MKNVTGLDLTKLNCGAHGTLGVLTEATIKLAPSPKPRRRSSCRTLGESTAIEAMTRALGSPFGVSGAAWLAPGMGRDVSRTLLRLEGFARVGRLPRRSGCSRCSRDFGASRTLTGEESAALWRSVRDAEFIAEPRDRADLAGEPRALAGGAVRRQPRRDGARPFLRLGRRPRLGRDRAERSRGGGGSPRGRAGKGHATLMRAPDSLRAAVEVFEPPSARALRLSRGLKQSFDPDGVLNFGRMYEGI